MDPTRRNSTWLYLIDVEMPLSPRNRALWTKMRILLSRLDSTDSGSDFDDPNPVPGLVSPVTPERFQAWLHVENADFVGMAMSHAGRVVFKDPKSSCVLVDQEALNTGMVLLCEFESNARLATNAHTRIRPWFLYEYWTLILGLGWLDMERPILQVLEESSMVLHGPWCQVEDFKKRINKYAPGYLSMEEAGKGMAPDYDHAKLVTRNQ
ncbi:Obg-like ATPase [Pestalotiopsis sp. IQ-011]